jgi:hypothetical protein
MNVYPDGEALSDWERQILDEMEQQFDMSDPDLVALLFEEEPLPLYALAASLIAAEAAVALAALTVAMAATMAGLATMGTTLWVTSVHATPGLRTTPGRANRGRP